MGARGRRGLPDRQPRALVVRAVVWAAFPRCPRGRSSPSPPSRDAVLAEFPGEPGGPIGRPHTLPHVHPVGGTVTRLRTTLQGRLVQEGSSDRGDPALTRPWTSDFLPSRPLIQVVKARRACNARSPTSIADLGISEVPGSDDAVLKGQ